MFELDDGSIGTIAGPAEPQPQNYGTNVLGDSSWTPLNASGVGGRQEEALTYPPAWQAIRQISGDGATLQCNLEYLDDDGDWVTAEDHPLQRLSTQESNGIQTASIYKETLWHHALWFGDGRAAIIRDGAGTPMEEIPLLPDRTWTMLIADEATRETTKLHVTNVYHDFGSRHQGRQQYIQPADQGSYVVLEDKDVFHFQGLSYDGISGYNVARMFRRTFSIGTGSEAKISVSLERAGVPPLVLIAPPGAFKTEQAASDFLKNWNEYHAGILNSGKTGLLREGIQPHQLSPTNTDDQFIEWKKLTRQDVASIFNMPVQMLGDTDAATLNNVEQMFKWYNNRTFQPWGNKWNQERSKKMLTARMKATRRYRYRYDCKPLDFVDADSRSRYYDSLRKNNAASGDDIRQMEGLKRLGLPETTSYANPNTSSDKKTTEGDDTDDEPQAASDLIKVRCKELAAAEVERIERDSDCVMLDTFQRRIDKAFSWQAKRLASVLAEYGGDTDQISGYCTLRKQMIFDRVADSGGDHRDTEVDAVGDVAEHIYRTLFGGNGKP